MSEMYQPVTSHVGYLRTNIESVAHTMKNWMRQLGKLEDIENCSSDYPQILDSLLPLTRSQTTKYLLLPAGEWTAVFVNNALGNMPPIEFLAAELAVPGLIVVDVPRNASSKNPSGSAGSRQWILVGPGGFDSGSYLRVISASYDGKWTFTALGEPLAFEEVERYSAKRIADRLTSDMLVRYTEALGVTAIERGSAITGVVVRTTADLPVVEMGFEEALVLRGM